MEERRGERSVQDLVQLTKRAGRPLWAMAIASGGEILFRHIQEASPEIFSGRRDGCVGFGLPVPGAEAEIAFLRANHVGKVSFAVTVRPLTVSTHIDGQNLVSPAVPSVEMIVYI